MKPKKTDKTATYRQRVRRDRLAKQGLRQRSVYVHDDDWPDIRALINQLMQARLPADE